MNLKKLETELSKLGKERLDLSRLLSEATILKKSAVSVQDEDLANKLWVYESILTVHQYYTGAYQELKKKHYGQGWNMLERAEIEINGLKRHIHLVRDNYQIRFLETMISRFQILFPYRIFGSSELLEQEIVCSICDQKVSLRNPCGHRVGELYMGEYCLRMVTKFEILGLALVENPVNKYSVMFQENDDPAYRDKVQFGTLNYILDLIKGPYEQWRVDITEKLFPHSDYSNLNPTDSCPCNSGKNYVDCCLLEPGVRGFDYQFLVKDSTLARAKVKRI